MKIGKFPIKRKYSIPRLIADIVSVFLIFIITYLTIVFISDCDEVFKLATVQNDKLDALQTNKYFAFIPVIIAFVFSAYSVVYVLISKKAPKNFELSMKTAQKYYIILADSASLIRIPVLLALFELSYYLQNIIMGLEISYFSVQFLCDIVLAVIIVRFSMHRMKSLCNTNKINSVSENPVIMEIEEKQITEKESE